MQQSSILSQSTSILKNIYGQNATFRDGQYEAIEATLTNKRTIVVQKTGWGKSLVYFVCTKINRDNKKGVTMVVSPLLVLMENQIEAARNLGLRCDVLNSTVQTRKKDILDSLRRNELDLILVTPETLFSEEVYGSLSNINIGLFVIDEVHCISDWGHDFRLEYGKLYKILQIIPKNVPVLGTTATANDRVVKDLKRQLGNEVFVSRGPLSRDSLAIQVLKISNKAERYAWIVQHVNTLPGSGIVYCLTRRDCERLSNFLSLNGIASRPYFSGIDEEFNRESIDLFMKNKIKVIVSTIKLGMGYDKGDVGFVIHFQQPSNIVSYYQQIGRAGRNIKHANVILMSGTEDNDIIDYFIDNAFPTEDTLRQILDVFKIHNGSSINGVMDYVNQRRKVVSQALTFLEHEEYLYKEKSKYYRTPKQFIYNQQHYDDITSIRRSEKEQMNELINTKGCLSRFIVGALDDKKAKDCGKCQNCLKKGIISTNIDQKYIIKASDYINISLMKIEPRKKWPSFKNIEYVNQEGLCLSKYGDPGYGEMVKQDKYSGHERFRDELLKRSCETLKPLIQSKRLTYITNVPSLRSNIVEDFAKRLAKELGLTYISLLGKKTAQPQKSMQNSNYQYLNAFDSFYINERSSLPQNIILVDDVVDSKWTLTVCGYLLMKSGCKEVYPFALADSSMQEE